MTSSSRSRLDAAAPATARPVQSTAAERALAAIADSAGWLADPRPLVLHVVYRFDVGGLENGVVNLINTMPADAYRHAVLALTEATDFKARITRADVPVLALHQPAGHGFWMYPTLFRLFRALRPAIVHTRNLAALEAVVPAWAARVPVRIHGEHGRDVGDLRGGNRKYQWVRRAYRPFVHHYVALGSELHDYLLARIGVAPARVTAICNGVDTTRFHSAAGPHPDPIAGCPFDPARHFIVGSVGRMQAVKDPLNLARAFVRALERQPALRARLRLVMVGDGPLRAEVAALLAAAGVADLAWLPGERNDVAVLMRGLHAFVLPSLAEGISNTILEALATGVPVIATAVGANAELVDDGATGLIVPADDAGALGDAIAGLAADPARAGALGRAARAAAESRFALEAMTASYQALYDRALARRGDRALARRGDADRAARS